MSGPMWSVNGRRRACRGRRGKCVEHDLDDDLHHQIVDGNCDVGSRYWIQVLHQRQQTPLLECLWQWKSSLVADVDGWYRKWSASGVECSEAACRMKLRNVGDKRTSRAPPLPTATMSSAPEGRFVYRNGGGSRTDVVRVAGGRDGGHQNRTPRTAHHRSRPRRQATTRSWVLGRRSWRSALHTKLTNGRRTYLTDRRPVSYDSWRTCTRRHELEQKHLHGLRQHVNNTCRRITERTTRAGEIAWRNFAEQDTRWIRDDEDDERRQSSTKDDQLSADISQQDFERREKVLEQRWYMMTALAARLYATVQNSRGSTM